MLGDDQQKYTPKGYIFGPNDGRKDEEKSCFKHLHVLENDQDDVITPFLASI